MTRAILIGCPAHLPAALLSPGWSEQGGVSLSVNKAEAQQRVYITRGYAARAAYVEPGSWYAVRAYYLGGPWSGPGYSYAGWEDYAARNGIGCTPGTAIKGGDRITALKLFPAEQSPPDFRKAIAAWQATLADGTHVYVTNNTGSSVSVISVVPGTGDTIDV